jgi:uncharacterized SAM-binding protein YcdF (DUF218 family)
MTKPRFWEALWRMALLMLGLYVAVLLFVRGPLVMPLIFSGLPTAALLEPLLAKPLLGWVSSQHRLEVAIWMMIVASYLQWTFLAAFLSYLWQIFWYRRRQTPSKDDAI